MIMQFEDEILRRLRRWAGGEPAPPLRLVLLLTERCNLDCLFCDVPQHVRRGKGRGRELRAEQWMKVVKEGIELGVLEWWFPGRGEPFFYSKNTIEVVRSIKDSDPHSYCHFTTNGTFLLGETARAVVKLGVDDINFSLEAANEKVHDSLRNVTGAFRRTSEAMRTISQLKESSGLTKPVLSITTVLTRKNYRSLPGIVEFGSEVGVERITINPLRITHGNVGTIKKHHLQVPPGENEKVRDVLKGCYDDAEGVGIQLQLNAWDDIDMGPLSGRKAEGFVPLSKQPLSPVEPLDGAACYEPFYTMGVNSYGKASYCPSSSGVEGDDADVFDVDVLTQGLREVWYGRFMMEARQRMLDNTPYYSCFGCGVKQVRMGLKNELSGLDEIPQKES